MSTNYPQVGGYPQYPQYPQYTPPAYSLYDVGAVALAALGAPLAGTILIASNYRKLGQGGNAFLALLLGAAASAVEIYLALTSAKNPGIAALVLFAVTWFAANELQGSAIKTHVAWGGQLYSKWRGVGVGILTSLVLGAGFVASDRIARGQHNPVGVQLQERDLAGSQQAIIRIGGVLRDRQRQRRFGDTLHVTGD